MADAQIAAICRARRCVLVTRNIKDLPRPGGRAGQPVAAGLRRQQSPLGLSVSPIRGCRSGGRRHDGRGIVQGLLEAE